nr:hypothetical protein [Tanacetum cinerariifolium]
MLMVDDNVGNKYGNGNVVTAPAEGNEDTLQQTFTSGTQSDNAPVYNSDESAENLKDSSDLTTAMNTTLALLAQAFKVNTIPMNNNQRSSLIPRNSQIAQSRHQDANERVKVNCTSEDTLQQTFISGTQSDNAPVYNSDESAEQCLVTVNHDVSVLNCVNDMNSRADNQSANVSKRENQKKVKANAKKSNELGSKGSLASSRPSKPRTCLR